MCGRYQLVSEVPPPGMQRILDEIARRYAGRPALEQMQTGEVRPTDIVPVLANSKSLEPKAFLMRWGFAGSGSRPLINARSETALDKPTFRAPLLERRCLVPAAHYFEWEKSSRCKYRMEAAGDMLYMAGFYRYEADPALPAFTILTRPASPCAERVHHRMPVILPGDLALEWLRPDADIAALIAAAQDEIQPTPLGDIQERMEF